MLFGYSRGIKDPDTGYTEFQPERELPERQPLLDTLPCCLWGDWAVSKLLVQSSVQSPSSDQSRTQAALTFGGTRACTGRAKPPDGCYCHPGRLPYPWHPAGSRLLFNLLKWSCYEVNLCEDTFSLLPAAKGTSPVLSVASPSPSSFLPLGAAASPSHSCAKSYLQWVCPLFLRVDVSWDTPAVWEELHKWVSNWGLWRQTMQ